MIRVRDHRSRTRAPQPNQRMVNTGWRLEHHIAPLVTQALEHINQQLAHLDGYPTATMSDGTPHGTAEMTSVERVTHIRYSLGAQREQIRDDLEAVEQLVASLDHDCRHVLRLVAQTRDAQPGYCDSTGREGAIVWADPTCRDLATKAGLCGRCYQREYRYRKEHGLEPREIEPGAA